ncbi:MAG: urea amidolyase, partial [Chloroflexia bacterium]|nr:urea amidolyase [Chloroflexia bacterium]
MMEVLEGGIQTTIQDFPGRQGLLDQGICPAGPFDNLAFRLANVLVGNAPGDAALEITAGNFKAAFTQDAVIAVTGANMEPKLDGEPIALWRSYRVRAGQTLALGTVKGAGFRSYVAVSGAFDVPDYLGSKATYAPGAIGGFEGRALKKGDQVPLGDATGNLDDLAGRAVKADVIPDYSSEWVLEAVPGPQTAPDYWT